MKIRLDQYLLQRNFAQSRERAKALIMAGIVYVNGEKSDKAGDMINEDAVVEVRGKDLAYVSRGGLKLEKAIDAFGINLSEKICMDIGASTGGFTDCMLVNGAKKVYAVDVGYGQLAWKLRCDEKVVNMERTNIRNVTLDNLNEKIDFFSVDVSFISLFHIFSVAKEITHSYSEGVCLIKPQFEAGREFVGKNGVVKEKSTHVFVVEKCIKIANDNNFNVVAVDFSPIKGPKGNIEFLMHVKKINESEKAAEIEKELIESIVEKAHGNL